MIKSCDISVVVQGSVTSTTKKCLESIRKYLPDAEIILSTWQDANVRNLEQDILILNPDPGGKKHSFFFNAVSMNNCNRQLVSSQNGLKKVERKYCLKLRSDITLVGDGFLDFWDQFPVIDSEFQMFQHRVLVSTVYSREYCYAGYPMPFHVSDYWFFGLTKDLKKYFLNTALPSDDELANYLFKYPNKLSYSSCFWIYPPEQYFCFSYVKQIFPDIVLDDRSDWNETNIQQSLAILANNFTFLELEQSGIYCPKHGSAMKNTHKIVGLITHHRFLKLYQTYCDLQFNLPLKHEFSSILNAPKVLRDYHKLKQQLKWLLSPALAVFYSIRLLLKIIQAAYKK